MANNVTLEQIAEQLKGMDELLLLCHKNPDADTLGSALGLKKALEYLGKTVHISCAHDPSENTAFLFDNEEDDIADRDYGDIPVVSIDVATLSLLGDIEEYYRDSILIKIDHHEMSDDFAEYNYADPASAACGEIIFDLVKLLGAPLCEVAEPLYAAISADTGGFRYSNTTSRTHRIAAELLEAGADNSYIDHKLFESKTQAEIRALNAAYSNLRYFHDGAVAAVVITNQIKERLNISEHDLGVISSITREIAGVTVGITLRQQKNNPQLFKLSVRSEPGFPANELCFCFGGGGHACAAGAELTAPTPERALTAVVNHIKVAGGRLIVV